MGNWSIFVVLVWYVAVVFSEYTSLKAVVADGFSYSDTLADYKKIGEKYYFIDQNEQVNWFRAWQKCRQRNGFLASFNNAEEMKLVSDVLVGSDAKGWFWLSGNDLAVQGDFVWTTNGNSVGRNLFSQGQPDFPGKERCLQLWKQAGQYSINNWICENKAHFICQLEAKNIQINVL